MVGLCALAWRQCAPSPIQHGPGIRAASSPVQTPIRGTAPRFALQDFTIIAQAEFEIEARVLSTKRYIFGTESELSPFDLALGWGPMSDSSVLDQLKISQSGRYYFYRWQSPPPLPPHQMRDHSANMHMIPANPSVARALKRVRVGHNVRVSGFLVNVERSDGWHWRSSLSRTDSGSGACELVWVNTLDIIEP